MDIEKASVYIDVPVLAMQHTDHFLRFLSRLAAGRNRTTNVQGVKFERRIDP
ncbi:hypothetical protein RA593_004916, partial [Salmonella enterica]|nr:hypothetical protein [Salmonella enterica]